MHKVCLSLSHPPYLPFLILTTNTPQCGNTPPIKIKNKDKWIAAERLRWARAFDVPISGDLPPDFPAPTLPVGRVLCAIAASDDAEQTKLVRALDRLFAAHWVEGLATHRPEVMREVLTGLFGEEEAVGCMFFSLSLFPFPFPCLPLLLRAAFAC